MQVPIVPVEIGGVQHGLRFNFAAFGLIEKATGLPFTEALNKVRVGLKLDDLSLLVWAGLAHEDTKRTQDEVAGLIADENPFALLKAVTDALTAAIPLPKDGGKN